MHAYLKNADLASIELTQCLALIKSARAKLEFCGKCPDTVAGRAELALDMLKDVLLPLSRAIALADYARVQAEKEAELTRAANSENISETHPSDR